MRVVKFCAFLLSLIILNHNFYILQPIDLMENTEMNSAKLKLNPWCLIPFPRLVNWILAFWLFSLEQRKILGCFNTILYCYLGWMCSLKGFPSYSKIKKQRDILEVSSLYLLCFCYRTNAISKLMHSVSNLTDYSLVFLVSEMWLMILRPNFAFHFHVRVGFQVLWVLNDSVLLRSIVNNSCFVFYHSNAGQAESQSWSTLPCLICVNLG